MRDLVREAQQIGEELTAAVDAATTSKELEAVRIRFLGRDGIIGGLLAGLKDLSAEAKRETGPILNSLRTRAGELLETAKGKIEAAEIAARATKKASVDVTAYEPRKLPHGSLHIYSAVIEEIEDILSAMGFAVFDGPEVETDFYNFTALNIPKDHPARDMQDTFWITPGQRLLRTHTSTIQIHALQDHGVPIAACGSGRVYRSEATDASHDATFTQIEGILVDKEVSIAHLFGVSQRFLRMLFNSKTLNIRLRPGFFPFVEPGIEIDMSCIFCKSGCPVCKHTGWIELGGSGMIHPNVLKSVTIDPSKFSGFAFGLGIERLAMLRHGIDDIRLFHAGKIAFLKQF